MNFTSRRVFGAIWALCLVLFAVELASHASGPGWLRSNVFELLPNAEYDALTALAVENAERELSGRLLFLVGHPDRSQAAAVAQTLADGLAANSLIDRVSALTSADRASDIARFYFSARRQLLSDEQVARIEADEGVTVERQALAALYSPVASVSSAMLQSDPFSLFPESLRGLSFADSALEFSDGYLWVEHDGIHYVFVTARTVSATLDMGSQSQLADDIELLVHAASDRDANLQVLRTGFLFYADAGTESARSEISVIGTGSVIGIIVLMLWLFRSMQPLLLGLLTVLSGLLVAAGVTLWVFGSIHLFTLVFGASLIGVSVDYTFHYLAEEFLSDSSWTPEVGLRRIFPGITLGLATSVIAYLSLTVAPFPGLKQLAVFSAAGLIGAYLTLLSSARWFRTPRRRTSGLWVLKSCAAYLDVWGRTQPRSRWVIGGFIALVALAGVANLQVDDDVSVLQTRPEHLRQQETAIANLLGAIPSNTFLLVRAASTEEVLQLEESVRASLDGLIESDVLQDYVAVSRSLPSMAKQQRSLDAYTELVQTRMPEFLSSVGLPDVAIGAAMAELTGPAAPLAIDDWLDHTISEDLGSLWIGAAEGYTASIVLLEGVGDVVALRAALESFTGVSIIDKTADLSTILGAYRVRVTGLLAAGYMAIFLMLTFRYGLARAAILLVPPVLAALTALGAGGMAGMSLNLFNLLALILVLGIGIDFTLFIAESHGELEATMLAITLSAVTTILSFGLLALSETNAVRSFGFTVLIGIACSYLLAPMAASARSRE